MLIIKYFSVVCNSRCVHLISLLWSRPSSRKIWQLKCTGSELHQHIAIHIICYDSHVLKALLNYVSCRSAVTMFSFSLTFVWCKRTVESNLLMISWKCEASSAASGGNLNVVFLEVVFCATLRGRQAAAFFFLLSSVKTVKHGRRTRSLTTIQHCCDTSPTPYSDHPRDDAIFVSLIALCKIEKGLALPRASKSLKPPLVLPSKYPSVWVFMSEES